MTFTTQKSDQRIFKNRRNVKKNFFHLYRLIYVHTKAAMLQPFYYVQYVYCFV